MANYKEEVEQIVWSKETVFLRGIDTEQFPVEKIIKLTLGQKILLAIRNSNKGIFKQRNFSVLIAGSGFNRGGNSHEFFGFTVLDELLVRCVIWVSWPTVNRGACASFGILRHDFWVAQHDPRWTMTLEDFFLLSSKKISDFRKDILKDPWNRVSEFLDEDDLDGPDDDEELEDDEDEEEEADEDEEGEVEEGGEAFKRGFADCDQREKLRGNFVGRT